MRLVEGFEIPFYVLRSVVIGAITGALLAGCLSSGGGTPSGDNDDEVAPLAEAAGDMLREHYQPLGGNAVIVLDTKTNLVWKRCYYGQTWNAELSVCEGNARAISWPVSNSLIDSD